MAQTLLEAGSHDCTCLLQQAWGTLAAHQSRSCTLSTECQQMGRNQSAGRQCITEADGTPGSFMSMMYHGQGVQEEAPAVGLQKCRRPARIWQLPP